MFSQCVAILLYLGLGVGTMLVGLTAQLAVGSFAFAGAFMGDDRSRTLVTDDDVPLLKLYDTFYWRGVALRHKWVHYLPSEPALTIAEVSVIAAVVGLVIWRKWH
jgi:hypothetical protein